MRTLHILPWVNKRQAGCRSHHTGWGQAGHKRVVCTCMLAFKGNERVPCGLLIAPKSSLRDSSIAAADRRDEADRLSNYSRYIHKLLGQWA